MNNLCFRGGSITWRSEHLWHHSCSTLVSCRYLHIPIFIVFLYQGKSEKLSLFQTPKWPKYECASSFILWSVMQACKLAYAVKYNFTDWFKTGHTYFWASWVLTFPTTTHYVPTWKIYSLSNIIARLFKNTREQLYFVLDDFCLEELKDLVWSFLKLQQGACFGNINSVSLNIF